MTFERIEPGKVEWEAYYANHFSRYCFAASYLQGRAGAHKILDAACGVGYGSHHLAGALGSVVVAIDRDRKALDIARRDFQLENVRFVEDDCETLEAARPLGPFHALVSFETLEHLRHPEVFLAAAAEMLSSNGVALVSVPNGDVFTSQDWEFHARDYNASDLEELLSQVGFRHLELFGQYLTPLGRLREQVRAEVHRIRFNPFFRLGAWLQERLRHHRLPPALPEKAEDFEIRPTNAVEIRRQGKDGPFVILAAATSFAPR